MSNEDNQDNEDGVEESYQIGLSEEVSLSLRVGGSYLIKEKKSENAMLILIRLLNMGMKSLCISSTIPKKLRSKYGLKESDVEIIWLSGAEGNVPSYNPSRIDFEVMGKISDFMKDGGKAILLDCLEMIDVANGFDKAIEFVKTLSDFAAIHDGIFLLSLNPVAFKREQLATLEWQLEPLSFPLREGEESDKPEKAIMPPSELVKKVADLENQLLQEQSERGKIENDNRRLADGIISITGELENNQELLKYKEEENAEFKRQIDQLNNELKEMRMINVDSSRPSENVRQQEQLVEDRIKSLEEEKKRLDDIVSRRDNEIRHLGLIINEKDESLNKKSEMLKDLLAKVTDVEVRIKAPTREAIAYTPMQPIQVKSAPLPPNPRPQLPAKANPPKPLEPMPIRQGNVIQCPNCGNNLIKISSVGDTQRLFCEKCRKWYK